MVASLRDHLVAPGPKRVLSLDGGGVKGIITIAFLEKIEEALRVQSGRGEEFRLSDYFDLVGGTSVGSLLALTLLQWLSAPKRRWEINSEVGTLEGELLGLTDVAGGARPMLSFVRYDARLERKWLSENCTAGRQVSDDYIAGLQQLDRPDMMDEMYRVGAVAAGKQVTPDDFPEEFELSDATQPMALT